ncbi:MAG: ECF-type sigma factor [Planctomycetota bacterium]|nr:ECF-type sigma factor [Planctomycetota bacterium]MDA1248300.1 ECF-type sigma factor [Planctomycetota bacterium]
MSESPEKSLRVTVLSPDGDQVLRASFPASETISIGRSSESDIHLADFGTAISRCHAVILFDGTNWEYYNLGVNGSFRNGRKVESVLLNQNLAIRLGKRGPILQLRPDASLDDSSSFHDSQSDDVSGWIERIRNGDEDAAQMLWDRYAEDIIEVARRSMKDAPKRVQDEEDVAVIAFKSLLAGIVAGRFPELDRREQLWRLLLVITTRKAAAIIEKANRQKRGGGEVRGDSAMFQSGKSPAEGFDQLPSQRTTPVVAAAIADEAQNLLAALDETSQKIAALKMEGYTHEEVAEKLGVNVRTVERRLKAIREQWQKIVDEG